MGRGVIFLHAEGPGAKNTDFSLPLVFMPNRARKGPPDILPTALTPGPDNFGNSTDAIEDEALDLIRFPRGEGKA